VQLSVSFSVCQRDLSVFSYSSHKNKKCEEIVNIITRLGGNDPVGCLNAHTNLSALLNSTEYAVANVSPDNNKPSFYCMWNRIFLKNYCEEKLDSNCQNVVMARFLPLYAHQLVILDVEELECEITWVKLNM
jgi:hypothetical protein